MLEFKNSIDSFEELREATWCCEFVLDAIENTDKEDVFSFQKGKKFQEIWQVTLRNCAARQQGL